MFRCKQKIFEKTRKFSFWIKSVSRNIKDIAFYEMAAFCFVVLIYLKFCVFRWSKYTTFAKWCIKRKEFLITNFVKLTFTLWKIIIFPSGVDILRQSERATFKESWLDQAKRLPRLRHVIQARHTRSPGISSKTVGLPDPGRSPTHQKLQISTMATLA